MRKPEPIPLRLLILALILEEMIKAREQSLPVQRGREEPRPVLH
ncbi:hypothetical protein [Pseudaminobacter soli (ex Zhang et al. 2022)]|nr:hypothetical protein [Pseudaminobacter soli]